MSSFGGSDRNVIVLNRSEEGREQMRAVTATREDRADLTSRFDPWGGAPRVVYCGVMRVNSCVTLFVTLMNAQNSEPGVSGSISTRMRVPGGTLLVISGHWA
jgi:hypothetical protein